MSGAKRILPLLAVLCFALFLLYGVYFNAFGANAESMMAFFGITEMVVPCSSYWNMGFGLDPGDVGKDAEAMHTMDNLGDNMAFVLQKLKC